MGAEKKVKAADTSTLMSIDAFFEAYGHNIIKANLATKYKVERQQIGNWNNSSMGYCFRVSLETGKVAIVLPEREIKTCVLPLYTFQPPA